MTDILEVGDFPSIRAVIGIDVDATQLPDATIQLPVFQFAGESAVKAAVPDWETKTGDDAIHIENAAIYYIAALIVPAMPHLVAERAPDGQNYQRVPINPTAFAAELRARAADEIAQVETPGTSNTADKPRTFSVASGRRGW